MKKKGFTMLEIFIATAMMGLVMIGLANVFLACKRLILHSREKMTAAELASYFLDPLYMNVTQADWSGSDYVDTNPLSKVSPNPYNDTSETLPSGGNFTANYTLREPPLLAAGTQMRKVVLNITWNEAE